MAKYAKERRQPNTGNETGSPKNEDGTDAPGYFTHPRGHVRDRIILHETMDSPKEGQFVGLNGFPFLVQYNKEIDVPRPIIQMLRTRIADKIEKDPQTGIETVRHISRFNFSVVKENVNQIPQEEVGAFTCPVCEKSFDRKIAYLGHMKSHDRKEAAA